MAKELERFVNEIEKKIDKKQQAKQRKEIRIQFIPVNRVCEVCGRTVLINETCEHSDKEGGNHD